MCFDPCHLWRTRLAASLASTTSAWSSIFACIYPTISTRDRSGRGSPELGEFRLRACVGTPLYTIERSTRVDSFLWYSHNLYCYDHSYTLIRWLVALATTTFSALRVPPKRSSAGICLPAAVRSMTWRLLLSPRSLLHRASMNLRRHYTDKIVGKVQKYSRAKAYSIKD